MDLQGLAARARVRRYSEVPESGHSEILQLFVIIYENKRNRLSQSCYCFHKSIHGLESTIFNMNTVRDPSTIHELPPLTSTRSNHSGTNNHGYGDKDSSIDILDLGLAGDHCVLVWPRSYVIKKRYANTS